MATYDDKTNGIIESGGQFVLPIFKPCDEAIFKASYIIASDIQCKGKITALFDLIVLGNLEATELDVKGRFVCLGKCDVNGTILVQNEIWANEIRANKIESNEKIVAQEIDCGTVASDGSIMVGKILAVEKLAKSEKNILCGETAYGAGKVIANVIITGEPIDLDDGEESIVSPSIYAPYATRTQPDTDFPETPELVDLIVYGEKEFAPDGNFRGYLDYLTNISNDDEIRCRYVRWQAMLDEAERICQNELNKYSNIALMIWLTEITASSYFKTWDKVNALFSTVEKHFERLLQDGNGTITCSIDSYKDWLSALSILSRFGALMKRSLSHAAFELVLSNLGLKAKFVSDRLNERGWQTNG